MFDEALSEAELSAWQSLRSVITNFLWETNGYEKEIEELLKSFPPIRSTNVKLHFLWPHLDYFLKNCAKNLSEEQGKRFHQDIRIMEERYKYRWDVSTRVSP